MKTRFARAAGFVAAMFFCATATAAATAATAVEDLGSEVDRAHQSIFARLSELKIGDELNPESALVVAREEALSWFDFPSLARRAVGKHWRRAGEEEKSEVARLFQLLLEKTYSNVLARYDGQQFTFVGARQIGEKNIATKIEISTAEAARVEIEYLFARRGDDWRVVDVKVEGISLLANYRRQFGKIIAKGGFERLIAELRAKTA